MGCCQFAIDDVEMVLVANKNDMEDVRTVKTSKGKQVLNSLFRLLSSSCCSFVLPHAYYVYYCFVEISDNDDDDDDDDDDGTN